MAALSEPTVVSTANFLLQCARRQPQLLREEALQISLGFSSAADKVEEGGSKWKSIHDKLIDLYLEYCASLTAEAEARREEGSLKRGLIEEDEEDTVINPPANLLGILVDREELNTLILKLYPGNGGYALVLKGQNGNPDTETMRLPYEEEEFLLFVDNQQLPPILSELLQQCHENYFYSGCVILEVHDFRRLPPEINSGDDLPFTHDYILLRPNNLNLVCGINGFIAASGPGDPNSRWTQEERDSLESQLLLATSDPLCLNPDPAVSLVFNKLQFQRQKLNRTSLRKSARKYGQVARNRRHFFASFPAPPELFLHDFLKQRGEDRKTTPAVNLRISKSKAVDIWRRRNVKLEAPKSGVDNVFDFAKALPFELPSTNALPVTVEEFILETERQTGKVNYTKVVIQQRPTDQMYVGELYVDRDFEDGKLKGCSCKFNLGTKTAVEKYIQQFTEIVTEEGRRPVKITHHVPGQAAKICSTPGLTLSNSTAKSNRRASNASSTSSTSNAGASNLPSTSNTQSVVGGENDAASAAKKAAPTHLKINLPGGVTATANVQIVAPSTSAPGASSGNVALLQSDAGNYQLISSDEESSSSGVPAASATPAAATTGNATSTLTANIANLQNLPAGTQLQFQSITQQQAQQQQQQQLGYGGLKTTPNRNNVASMGASRQGVQQVFTTTANIVSGNNANIFQNLSQLQQQQQQQQQQQSISANVLASPTNIQIQRANLQQQQQPQQQLQQPQQTFNRRTSGGLLRNAAATSQLRLHQQSGDGSASGGGGLIQIHPNSSQTGGPNIIQIHQGQILKSTNAATSSAGIIGAQADVRGGTISPGAATATIIPGNANASTINLANLQQIQIQQGTNNINLNTLSTQGGSNINLNSLPTQLQMSIGGVSVPVSLAAALSQSVSGNASGAGLQQVSTTSVPASIALALGSLAQSQSISAAPVTTTATKFLTTGSSGQVFVTSNALQQSGATIQPGSSTSTNVQLQPQQQSQQTQQLVMAATGPFLQINASGAQSGLKGASTQIRGNQIPLLQTVGVQQQQQNILVSNQKTVTLQQPQFRQHQIQQQQLQQQQQQQPIVGGQEQRPAQGTNIQIQNPTSTTGVPRFRLM